MPPTTLTIKGILVSAAQVTECLLLPCMTLTSYRATVGHGTQVSCCWQDPEFLT